MASVLALLAASAAPASAATLDVVDTPGGKQVRYIAGDGELNQVYLQIYDGKVVVQEGYNYGVVPVTAVSPCEARPYAPASTPQYNCPAVDVTAIYVDLGDQNDTISFGGMGSLGLPVTLKAGDGNDDIFSRDNFADQIDCGSGTDHLRSESTDTAVGCEQIEGGGGGGGTGRADGKPIGVSINGGATFTNSPNVTITAYGPDSATQLLLDNDGGFANALRFPIVDFRFPWTLNDSGPERLPRTVYARFEGGNLDPSRTLSDDIILDQTAPAVTAARAVGSTVRVAARDRTSGVGALQFKSRGTISAFRKFAPVTKIRGRMPGFVRVRDRAKNLSRWHSVTR